MPISNSILFSHDQHWTNLNIHRRYVSDQIIIGFRVDTANANDELILQIQQTQFKYHKLKEKFSQIQRNWGTRWKYPNCGDIRNNNIKCSNIGSR